MLCFVQICVCVCTCTERENHQITTGLRLLDHYVTNSCRPIRMCVCVCVHTLEMHNCYSAQCQLHTVICSSFTCTDESQSLFITTARLFSFLYSFRGGEFKENRVSLCNTLSLQSSRVFELYFWDNIACTMVKEPRLNSTLP